MIIKFEGIVVDEMDGTYEYQIQRIDAEIEQARGLEKYLDINGASE